MTTINTVLGQATEQGRDVFGSVRSRQIRSQFETWWITFQCLADFLCIVAGILVTDVLATAFFPNLHVAIGFGTASTVASLGIAVLANGGTYDLNTAIMDIRGLENLLRSAAIGFTIALAVLVIHGGSLSSLRPTVAMVVVLPALLLRRCVSSSLVRWLCAHEFGMRRVLVYGSKSGIGLVRPLLEKSALRWSCVAFLEETNEHALHQAVAGDKVIRGSWDHVDDVLGREPIDEIVVADPGISREKFMAIVDRSEALHIPVSFIPDPFALFRSGFATRLQYGIPRVTYRRNPPALTAYSKRTFDVLVSSLLIVLLSPVLVLLALLTKLDSRGPAIFRQERVGRDGQLFSLFKFRSMHVEAAAYESSPMNKYDPRISRVGRVLRRTSLDELPQLFNVLFGQMSIVGPRPEMPFIVAQYDPNERARLRVKPGITGLWQISHARPLPIHHNIGYDLFYIEHQNLFMDVAIMLATIGVVLRGRGLY
jgi:exopolysaccharide biosynthesis polyprenyl glycosylphosphotransferase